MAKKRFGAACMTVSLARHLNWPARKVSGEWWQKLAEAVGKYPEGGQAPWGVPFTMAKGKGPRVILAAKGRPDVKVPLRGKATFLCLLHEWRQLPETIRSEDPCEGLVAAEYEIAYADGARAVVPVRGRFEVNMAESPGPAWLAVPFNQWKTVDPTNAPPDWQWGRAQTGVGGFHGAPLLWAMPNPHPGKPLRSLTIRGLQESPLLVAGLTLYRGGSHPLRHLPRRTYRVRMGETPPKIAEATVDLGGVARIEQSTGPRGKKWLTSPYVGLYSAQEPVVGGEQLIEAFGSEDATLTVRPEGKRKLSFSLGEAFHRGQAACGAARLEVLGRTRQWMRVVIRDAATGKPTPARIHISGSRGEYIAPYGHHAQINARWFEDYGADVVAGGRNFAYVQGEFTSDLPVGDLYVELYKGFEYKPTRTRVTVRPGQEVLELGIERGADWRRDGWVTADTHVHFISPHTAWLQAQGEGVNVVNLLASQWGRLFTNVGDITGRVGVAEDDTVVYVGTENRNHMLGHMSMLGTKGLPVYPMCCGGPSESYVGDPDFMALAEWARENKRKGGVVIRPHYPYCGHTEDPVPILKGLVDALEIRNLRGTDFPTQEWYRYLNCGYRVAVCGGTDKMGAYCPLGWMRTYALLDPQRPLDYDAWAAAVRAGRTFSTTGPLIDMQVDGHRVGDTITMNASGGTLEVQAMAEAVWPLGGIEIVQAGRVVASERGGKGVRQLRAAAKVRVERSGWLAARCFGLEGHPGAYLAAHTSPVYVKVGDTRAFDGPAAEHMLALVEGGVEYLNTLATAFDEASRKRLVGLYKEAQAELRGRLLVEAKHPHHPGSGAYHTHGHGATPGHTHGG
ncbi:MAG: hypothetical protein FJ290_23605 [Planctomycetes bacterium]|nr:hypothetical protein [Planctomycetota bacterium]